MRVVVTNAAARDLQEIHDWWALNRSSEQASRWYVEIKTAIDRLRADHPRCSVAIENGIIAEELRQMHFGVGRRTTHRVVFVIDDDQIVVLRVRHVAQRGLTVDDLQRW